MKKVKVKIREKENVVITVTDITGKIELETVVNLEEADELIYDIMEVCDEIITKQARSNYKYPPVEIF